MSQFMINARDVDQRARALLKAAEQGRNSAGKALSRNFKQEQRLQDLVNMSLAVGPYGTTTLHETQVLFIDVEDAKLIELFK